MKTATQIAILDARKTPIRVALAAAILLAVAFGWFAARWQFGNMLAELTGAAEPNAREIAQLARNLAPADPLANWLVAGTKKNTFSPEIIAETEKNFSTVVALSPYDYRWWIELGRAREQAENYEAAEKAYLRAVELSPNYTYPRWQIGNFYLRRNRSEEAFAELKKAAAATSVYRDQVFSMAWEYYEQDTARLDQIAGDSAAVKAGLARFYATKRRAEEALRIWNTLSKEEKAANSAYARVIGQAFYDTRIYRQSMEFIRELEIEPEARHETVQNGGFEQPIKGYNETYFGWRVAPITKLSVELDRLQKREGSRSLRFSFNGYAEPTLYAVTQLVTVEPSAKYRLTFWVRTENLKSGGPPALEIYNASDDKNIVTSEAFATGTSDWQQVNLEFVAPGNAEAIGLRTVRVYCGTGCPIIGTFWYDDFKFEKIK
jgi:tetratricopeptide (TPR) repeat protein